MKVRVEIDLQNGTLASAEFDVPEHIVPRRMNQYNEALSHVVGGAPLETAPVSATEPEINAIVNEFMTSNVRKEFEGTSVISYAHSIKIDVAAMASTIHTLRARLAEAERVTEDSAIIDALAAREIEVECMGTTVPYWNVVVVKTGEMFTASPSLVQPTTLREALTRALTAARGGG
jgi:hypothetical protein